MNIPNLPTDNLYKFIALLGAVFLFVSLWYPMSHIPELQQKGIDSKAEREIIQLYVQALKEEAAVLKESISDELEAVTKLKNSPTRTAEHVATVRNRVEELQKKHFEFDQKALEIEKQTILLNAKNEQWGVLIEHQQRLLNFFFVGAPLGFLLMTVGFVRWYQVVQLPQDQILRQQLQAKPPQEAASTTAAPSTSDPAE